MSPARVITFTTPAAKPSAPAPAAQAEPRVQEVAKAPAKPSTPPTSAAGALVAIRIRGNRRVRETIEDALRSLSLTRANHCVVVPATPTYEGQLQKAKDYITWGPLGAKELAALIRARGRLSGNQPLTDAAIGKASGGKYRTIDEIAEAVTRGEARYADLSDVKPIFRLNPPRKGFPGGNKRSVGAHGNLGYRGPKISELIERMI